MPEGLGRATWIYYAAEDIHLPICSQRKGGGWCGNGPLAGEQIATGDCGDEHGPPPAPVADTAPEPERGTDG